MYNGYKGAHFSHKGVGKGVKKGSSRIPASKQGSKTKGCFEEQPCFEAGIRELPFLMPEPAEKPSLQGCEVQQ